MTTQPATITSAPQRMQALERANQVRRDRAELKRKIAEGRVSAAEVILEDREEAASWTVRELLMSQRRWGNARCRNFLEGNQISELKRLGELTPRQRTLLAGQLRCVKRPEARLEPPSPEPRLEPSPAGRPLQLVGGWASRL
jgi:hypothetical protein